VKAPWIGPVLRLDDVLIARFGGGPGIRDRSMLESALARPFAELEGTEAHATVHEKAAALMHGLATNHHPFVDGNERVALATTVVFLEPNGYRLAPDRAQRYELTLRVGDGSLGREELSRVFRNVIG
jgi:death-on-curing protein